MSNSWVSLDLSDETRSQLERLVEELTPQLPCPLTVMRSSELHMTLCFLGKSAYQRAKPDARLAVDDAITNCFASVASHHPALTWTNLELFPPGKRNLLVARLNASPSFLASVMTLQDVCRRQLQLGWDDSLFVPHITLGKFRGLQPDDQATTSAVISRHPMNALTAITHDHLAARMQGKAAVAKK